MADRTSSDRPGSEDLRQTSSTDDPAEETGVDPSLIRWFLSLSPLERLRTVQNYAASIDELKNGRQDS